MKRTWIGFAIGAVIGMALGLVTGVFWGARSVGEQAWAGTIMAILMGAPGGTAGAVVGGVSDILHAIRKVPEKE